MINALIFDMDGLLIDSEPLWHQAEQKVFASVGLKLSSAMCRETTGIRIDEVVRIRFRQFPWENKPVELITREIMEEVHHLAITQGKALPGVSALLEKMASQDYAMAVASSSPLPMIKEVLAHLGYSDYFSVLCSAEDEAWGKPHPAVYMRTAQALQVPAAQCLAFEDSIPGVIAARAASMRVIAIPDAHHLDRAEFGIATLTVPSMTGLLENEAFTALLQAN